MAGDAVDLIGESERLLLEPHAISRFFGDPPPGVLLGVGCAGLTHPATLTTVLRGEGRPRRGVYSRV